MDAETPGTHQEFSSFAFWREPIQDITREEDAEEERTHEEKEETGSKVEETVATEKTPEQQEVASSKPGEASQDPNSPEE